MNAVTLKDDKLNLEELVEQVIADAEATIIVTKSGDRVVVLPLDEYKAEVDRHVRELKESKRLPGVDEIRMPGERRRACREDRVRDGVPLAPALVAQLDKLASELAIKPLAAR